MFLRYFKYLKNSLLLLLLLLAYWYVLCLIFFLKLCIVYKHEGPLAPNMLATHGRLYTRFQQVEIQLVVANWYHKVVLVEVLMVATMYKYDMRRCWHWQSLLTSGYHCQTSESLWAWKKASHLGWETWFLLSWSGSCKICKDFFALLQQQYIILGGLHILFYYSIGMVNPFLEWG